MMSKNRFQGFNLLAQEMVGLSVFFAILFGASGLQAAVVDNNQPLLAAVYYGDIQTVARMLDEGADVEFITAIFRPLPGCLMRVLMWKPLIPMVTLSWCGPPGEVIWKWFSCCLIMGHRWRLG
jgi:hypothetical protein